MKRNKLLFTAVLFAAISLLCVRSAAAIGVSDSDGLDIGQASPEQIEDIGAAAMLEAGLLPEGSIDIRDAAIGESENSGAAENAGEAANKENEHDPLTLVALILSTVNTFILAWICVFDRTRGNHRTVRQENERRMYRR